MSRRQQFWILVFGLPVFVFFVLAAAQAGSPTPSCGWRFPRWFGCVLATHENLAAGLIATAGALFAGWLAYSAVQEQIRLSRSVDLAALEAVRLQVRELFELLNQAWRAIDSALMPGLGAKRKKSKFVRALVVLGTLPQSTVIDTIDFKQLNPIDQFRFGSVLAALRWFYRALEELNKSIEESEREDIKRIKLATLRTHLSHLEKFLQAFDPSLAAIFKGRTLAKVDHRSMAEHIRPFVDEEPE